MNKIIFSILLVTILILMLGCKAKTVHIPVETTKTQIEFVERWSKDSIYLHDSIFMKIKGDTIWMEKYKTLYKEKLVRDSIYIVDSLKVEIPYPVVEVKEVNRLQNWQIILMCLGGVLIGYLIFGLAKWIK